jgi:hypothetical protein
MGIPFRIEHSVGGFMNESSPNFIVHLPKSSIDEAVEVARVVFRFVCKNPNRITGRGGHGKRLIIDIDLEP